MTYLGSAFDREFRDLLLKCASTAMSSKLIHSQKPFFSKMVVDAVLALDQDDLDESLIGMKKIPGGGMQDSYLVQGVAFKKTFAYAGFEQQPKYFKRPKICCLNVELELKAERDNAEVRIEQVEVSQQLLLFFQILHTLTQFARTTNLSLMQSGRSSIPSLRLSRRLARKSFFRVCLLEIWQRSTLQTAISSVLVESQMTI